MKGKTKFRNIDIDITNPVDNVHDINYNISRDDLVKSTNSIVYESKRVKTNKSKSMCITKVSSTRVLQGISLRDKANDKTNFKKDYQHYVARHYARIEIGNWVSNYS